LFAQTTGCSFTSYPALHGGASGEYSKLERLFASNRRLFKVANNESREKPVHVAPRQDGWVVVREGNKKASAVHPTRHQAEEHGRSIARDHGTDFYLHDKDGKVLVHDIYGSRHEHEGEEAYGQKVGEVTVSRPDTGAVQRQVAYHDEKSGTWTVEVHTYPPLDESIAGISGDPMGRAPTESDTYERLSTDDLRRLHPELWEKVKS